MIMNFFERLKSDWAYLMGFRRIISAIGKFDPDADFTLADAVEGAVDAHRDRVFISFEGHEMTYAEFDARANRFAHWGLSIGLKTGDTIALFMENRPDYIAFWAGMAKIAVRTALSSRQIMSSRRCRASKSRRSSSRRRRSGCSRS